MTAKVTETKCRYNLMTTRSTTSQGATAMHNTIEAIVDAATGLMHDDDLMELADLPNRWGGVDFTTTAYANSTGIITPGVRVTVEDDEMYVRTFTGHLVATEARFSVSANKRAIAAYLAALLADFMDDHA